MSRSEMKLDETDNQVNDMVPNEEVESVMESSEENQAIDTKVDNGEPEDEKLDERRALITQLLNDCEAKEGDCWFLIDKQYLYNVLSYPAQSFEHLKQVLGPIDTTSIVDANGMLYPEDHEPTETVFIHPQVFDHLVSWFGLYGHLISRALVFDEQGNKMVEKFPPYFVLHTLNKSTKPNYSSQTHQRPNGLFVSQTKTFKYLLDMIQTNFFKNSNKVNDFRIWFFECENSEDLTTNISLTSFLNEIPNKSLLFKSVYDNTLKSQNINSRRYHILIEVMDKSSNIFPIDTYIEDLDFEQLKLDNVLKKSGDVGLINLGNTCYMNSALQCLVHIPEINNYFFFDVYEKELNKLNPLGYLGNMALAFGSLLHKLFNHNSNQSSLSPREFKYTIGHFSSMFYGYQQQDSQEFLSWLLDALHEDLNRIYNKPYLEKPELDDNQINDLNAVKHLADQCWNQFKQRNDSLIVDLFSGLYQSTLVCPDCNKTSITFDPFNDLTLPLPINKKWYHTFTIVNLDFNQSMSKRIMKLQVELNKTSTLDELIDYLSDFLKVDPDYLFLFEVFNNFFYRDFQTNNAKYKFYPIGELINGNDEILVYIIPCTNNDIILPVLNSVPEVDQSYKMSNTFGIPLFITIDIEDAKSFGKVRGKLEQVIRLLTTVDLSNHYKEMKSTNKQYYNSSDFPYIKKQYSIESDEDDNEEGYNSDISLADPEIDGDYAFVIKFSQDSRKHNRSSKVHIPYTKPNLSKLPKLSDKLPPLKYLYYHYPSFKTKKESENEEFVMVNKSNESVKGNEDSKERNEEGEEEEQEDEEEEEEEQQEQEQEEEQEKEQDEEDEDSGSENIEKIGLLFDSVSTLNKAESETPQETPIDKHPILVNEVTLLVCEWENSIYEKLFTNNSTWEQIEEIANPQLEANKLEMMRKQNSTVSLYGCFQNFNKPEVLGEQDLWYCPRCKDHKQATKTIEIWSTGDILTIHLKRFQMARSFSDKIDLVVDFPITGLDMSQYVKDNPEDLVYDLIGVDNHYGGLGGGHYTASVLNFRDNQWYYYNDGRVTKIDDAQDTVTGAAYLLFYRKRSSKEFLGGEKHEKLIQEGRSQYDDKLKELVQQTEKVQQQIEVYRRDVEQGVGQEMEQEMEQEIEQGIEQEKKVESDDEDEEEIETNAKKTSRSSMNEDVFKKKRLLTKDKESIDSSPSVVSPIGSSSDDNIVSDNISIS